MYRWMTGSVCRSIDAAHPGMDDDAFRAWIREPPHAAAVVAEMVDWEGQGFRHFLEYLGVTVRACMTCDWLRRCADSFHLISSHLISFYCNDRTARLLGGSGGAVAGESPSASGIGCCLWGRRGVKTTRRRTRKEGKGTASRRAEAQQHQQ
jgi:hypothetical protein